MALPCAKVEEGACIPQKLCGTLLLCLITKMTDYSLVDYERTSYCM